MMSDLFVNFKKVDITPAHPVSLAGYFNKRVSKGILDPLYLRIAVLMKNSRNLVFIQLDNCAVLKEDVDDIKEQIAEKTNYKKEEIMLNVSHIHTGPDIVGLFGLPREIQYLRQIKRTIIEQLISFHPKIRARVYLGQADYDGLSYNRRWYLKDGTVVTNPPKMHPDMEKPEGPVDRRVNTIAFLDDKKDYLALFVNISNHTDTIGGNHISADWPGFMEKRINKLLKTNISVFPFIAPQGNINHFEFGSSRNQTHYGEAKKLGSTYANVVLDSLESRKKIVIDKLEAIEIVLSIPSRHISNQKLKRAQQMLEKTKVQSSKSEGKDMTSEDLMKENSLVERIFAKNLLNFHKSKPLAYPFPLQVFKLGKAAFVAIPGEPFVEIGLAIKKIKNYDVIFPVALANGYYGYIPLRENFSRGGYEIREGASNLLSTDTADRILQAIRNLLQEKNYTYS